MGWRGSENVGDFSLTRHSYVSRYTSGGLTLSGDPAAPGEISSQIGAMTGSHALLAKLKAMESPEASTGAKG
jgi:hypothetical protein